MSFFALTGRPRNLLEKPPEELRALREMGVSLLYIGPESGDDLVLKRIAKGATAAEHTEAARKAHAAGMKLSAIFLLGAGGVERSEEHARASAALASAMDPRFVSLLTLTVIPGTPIGRQAERGEFAVPDVPGLLRELLTFIAEATPTDAIFRTNHASNWLPLSGRLPRDRDAILEPIDGARGARAAAAGLGAGVVGTIRGGSGGPPHTPRGSCPRSHPA